MAVKRKTILVYALLSILIATMAGTGFVSLVKGNFEPAPHPTPITDPPAITLIAPKNGITPDSNVTVVFNVAMPPSWNWTVQTDSGLRFGLVGTIRLATCSLDGIQILYDHTTYGYGANTFGPPPNYYPDPNGGIASVNYSQEVGTLQPGLHSLSVSVYSDTYYFNGTGYGYYVVPTVNSTFTFTVVVPPVISDLSLANRTYDRPVVPLVFNVNDSTSWLGFSLDNQLNETISGNVTLTDLTEGNHSLVVYANDTYGNIGKSDTAYFTVTLPAPTPSPTPTPTATATTSSPSVPELPTWTSLPLIATATLLAVLLARKKKGPKIRRLLHFFN